ncbi:glycosyltransferase [Patescibacteria group bacterium]|nr:glycosyltransferase [Patescibacteria group bacterium]
MHFPILMIHSEPMKAATSARSTYPKISIVTPSYNQGQFLEQTIRSILDQGYPNLEYIIIDGGSTDDSKKIIKKYAPQLKYWVSERDQGQADAINKGFSHATGEIMGWLNSDDILMPGSLHLIAKIFGELPQVDWISSTTQTITQHGHVHHLGLRPVFFQKLIAAGWYHGLGLGFLMQEGTFWRRSLWEKIGAKVNQLHYGMDFELWKRFAEHTAPLAVHVPLAAFRLNPQRKSKAIQQYYQEIGVQLPLFFTYLSKGLRLGLQLPRKLRLTQQLYYDLGTERWQYTPDIFSRLTGKDQPKSFE